MSEDKNFDELIERPDCIAWLQAGRDQKQALTALRTALQVGAKVKLEIAEGVIYFMHDKA